MHRVAILTYDQVALFELGCAVELFGLPRPEFESWYECKVVSFSHGPLSSTSGVQLISRFVKNLDGFNLLVIPSWPVDRTEIAEDIATKIRKFYHGDNRIISFCSGAFLLAELGFLNGKKATTHWRYAEIFKNRYPEIEYVEDVLYVYDGHLGCSAGSSAAVDLGLEVIRSDFGFQVANKVARRLVLSAHRKGGQTQYAETPVLEAPSRFGEALDWAQQNLNDHIDISLFAEMANMSRRTFDRKFRTDFNLSPKEWLTHQRLILAKELLENSDHSIEKVAELSGFANAATMRHHFRRELGVSPSLHRERYKA
jgi:AraC family transcriptional activator FtrA